MWIENANEASTAAVRGMEIRKFLKSFRSFDWQFFCQSWQPRLLSSSLAAHNTRNAYDSESWEEDEVEISFFLFTQKTDSLRMKNGCCGKIELNSSERARYHSTVTSRCEGKTSFVGICELEEKWKKEKFESEWMSLVRFEIYSFPLQIFISLFLLSCSPSVHFPHFMRGKKASKCLAGILHTAEMSMKGASIHPKVRRRRGGKKHIKWIKSFINHVYSENFSSNVCSHRLRLPSLRSQSVLIAEKMPFIHKNFSPSCSFLSR